VIEPIVSVSLSRRITVTTRLDPLESKVKVNDPGERIVHMQRSFGSSVESGLYEIILEEFLTMPPHLRTGNQSTFTSKFYYPLFTANCGNLSTFWRLACS